MTGRFVTIGEPVPVIRLPSLPLAPPAAWRALAQEHLLKRFAVRDADTFLERTFPDQAPPPSAR